MVIIEVWSLCKLERRVDAPGISACHIDNIKKSIAMCIIYYRGLNKAAAAAGETTRR